MSPERIPNQMDENYRTLLGHFRHETGHYYWSVFDRLDPGFASRCQEFVLVMNDWIIPALTLLATGR
ncbi:MAG: putative zinc-binding metallopeptidase [Hahellaceae bacterium]|nr:putative zinc-binding metallopeptidase [Hahellaceae bacterium]